MKAVRIHAYGSADVLQYEDAPMPQVMADDVLIKITASSVNPVDHKVRAGKAQERWPVTFPYTLGWDVSGVVEETGTLITNYKKGDKVYARTDPWRNGAYAEYVTVRASDVSPAPVSIPLEHAAGIPLAGQTAWAGLFEQGLLQKGQSVLIHGGSGGVGTFAVQLAKFVGAHVTATTSAANIDLVKSLGADRVIDYKTQDFSKLVQGVDLVFDTIGGDTQKKSWGVIRKGGILVSTVGADEKAAKEHGVTAKSYMVDSSGGRLQAMTALVDAGRLRVIIDKTFPLTDVKGAHELSEAGHATGKIIIKVA